MTEPKTNCTTCGCVILCTTADRNEGRCAPCFRKSQPPPKADPQLPVDPALERCGKCNIRRIHAERPISDTRAVKIWFCPRCYDEVVGEEIDAMIHVESEFYVEVTLAGESLSKEQIFLLRKLDPKIRSQPISEIWKTLRQSDRWMIGPFWPAPDAAQVADELRAAGLDAEIR